MLGDARLPVEPEFSGDVKVVAPVTTRTPPGAAIQQWTLRAPTLRGQTLRMRGLEGSMTDVLVRIEFADGTKWVQRLTGDETDATIPMRQSGWSVAGVYLKLGVDHILFGADHVLFVLGLLLIVKDRWMLLENHHRFHRSPQHNARQSRRWATPVCQMFPLTPRSPSAFSFWGRKSFARGVGKQASLFVIHGSWHLHLDFCMVLVLPVR